MLQRRSQCSVSWNATFPDSSHPPILYPAARVSASLHRQADEFLVYLRSEEGAAIFARHGFTPPD